MTANTFVSLQLMFNQSFLRCVTAKAICYFVFLSIHLLLLTVTTLVEREIECGPGMSWDVTLHPLKEHPLVATGSKTGGVSVYNYLTGELVASLSRTSSHFTLTTKFSPNGKLLVSTHQDGTIQVRFGISFLLPTNTEAKTRQKSKRIFHSPSLSYYLFICFHITRYLIPKMDIVKNGFRLDLLLYGHWLFPLVVASLLLDLTWA